MMIDVASRAIYKLKFKNNTGRRVRDAIYVRGTTGASNKRMKFVKTINRKPFFIPRTMRAGSILVKDNGDASPICEK